MNLIPTFFYKKGYLMRWYHHCALLGLAFFLQGSDATAQFGGFKLPNLGGSGGGGGSGGLFKAPSSGNLGNSSGNKNSGFNLGSAFKAPSSNSNLGNTFKAPSSGISNAMKTSPLGGSGNSAIKAPTSGFGGALKTPTLGGNSSVKTPPLGGIKAPTSGIGSPLVKSPLGGSGIKTPTLGNLGGNSGPTFSGAPIKGKSLAMAAEEPVKKKSPVTSNPPKKGNDGVTSSVDMKSVVAVDPKPKTPTTPPIGPPKKPIGPSIVGPSGGGRVPPIFDPGILIPLIPSVIPGPQPQQTFQPQGFDPGPQPQQTFQPQPQPQYQQQPQQATYVEPAPQPAQGPRPAPQNSIVTKKRIQFNQSSNTVGLSLALTQAETDARQEVEAREAINTLDSATSKIIGTYVQASGDAQMNADWNAVFQGGNKTEDVQKFLEKYGPPPGNSTLPAAAVEIIGIRQEYAKYADALRNGSFTTPGERDTALANLQTSLGNFVVGKDPTFAATLQEKLTNMQNFNVMSQLAAASVQEDNPFLALIQGATQMEMPLAFVSEMTGYPVMGVEPTAEQEVLPSEMPVGPTGQAGPAVVPATILLANLPANGNPVGYQLGGYAFEMGPGDEQLLDRQYVLAFDTGNNSQRQYTLGTGYYEWRLDPQTGWDVYKTKVALTIDNSRYDGTFEYLVNGQLVRLAPGEVADHASDSLIEVAFHSGREGLEHRKLLKSGNYLVGLDPAYGALDLFKTEKVEAFEAKQPEYLSSTDTGGSRASQRERVAALLAQMKKPAAKDDKAVDAVATTAGTEKSAEKNIEKNTGKKKVSALGKSKPTASAADLLKMIKPKAAANAAVPEPPPPGNTQPEVAAEPAP